MRRSSRVKKAPLPLSGGTPVVTATEDRDRLAGQPSSHLELVPEINGLVGTWRFVHIRYESAAGSGLGNHWESPAILTGSCMEMM